MKVTSPWPTFSEQEIKAVSNVLSSGKVNYWTGEEGKNFEKEFAELCDTKYAIAVTNGTAALELALKALGIGFNDEVIGTPRTFFASSSCIVAAGAKPVFADVENNSGNITAKAIEAVLSPNTKAIIVVHLAGMPCEMDEIMELARKHDLYVIEDCAQAHGAKYKNRPVGSIGHVGAFSFCQDKIITTGGEGGMFVTNDEKTWKHAWAYKDHGKSYDATFNVEYDIGFRWLIESFGTNFRMTEMQSAIGRLQLKLLPEWTKKREENANRLDACIQRIRALKLQIVPEHMVHARYKYYTQVDPSQLKSGWNRDRIREAIRNEGVPCFSGSCSEIYREKAFEVNNLAPSNSLPMAQELGDVSLMFLIHPTLTEDEMYATTEAIEKIMSFASK